MREQRAKIGDKIKIVNLYGDKSYTGKIGIIERIDDRLFLHGTWGESEIIVGLDKFNIIGGQI